MVMWDMSLSSILFVYSEPLFIFQTAGFGQRDRLFCKTNIMGPDAFALCGTPQSCDPFGPQLEKCGIDFIYDGQRHQKCLKSKPPSSFHPICKEYSIKNGKM